MGLATCWQSRNFPIPTRRAGPSGSSKSVLFYRTCFPRTSLSSPTIGGVQVLIGGEGTWDDLRQCSVILARYGMPGMATGTLGVLGPMRMSYGRTISTIRFLSSLLSELVADTLVD